MVRVFKAAGVAIALGLLGCDLGGGSRAAEPTPSPSPSFAPGTRWEVIAEPKFIQMNALDFVNPQDAWAVGGSNVVIRSQDGGKTWAAPEATPSTWNKNVNSLDSVSFVDPRFGFVGGSFGVFQTTDGGASWAPVRPFFHENGPPPSDGPTYVRFRDYEHGVVYRGGELHETKDGGKTWKPVPLAPGPFRRLGMIGQAFAAMTDGGIKVSRPDGTWGDIALPTPYEEGRRDDAYNDFFFLDEQVGMVTGPAFSRTTDGGKTWTPLANLQGAKRIHFLDLGRGWAIDGRSWKYTRTAGATWDDVPYQAYGGDSRNVPMGFEALDATHVYVFTGTGVIRQWIAP